MNQKFDWQAEDSAEWPVPAGETDLKNKRRKWRRRLVLGVALLVFLAAAFISIQRIEQFVGETGVEIEQEVAASNELVLEAARLADSEILASLISGRDPEWADAQLSLVASGLMFDRSPFGFELIDESFKIIDIVVSPEFDSAEVVVGIGYDIMSMAGTSESVYLQQDLHYRRSNDRWLLSPPGGDYWGTSVVDEGYYLTIRFSERDSTIGNRLALDLEALVASFCSLEPTGACSTRMPVQINLVPDPSSISSIGKKARASFPDSVLELPSPTLFGIPESDHAYRALYRSYSELVVGYLMATESDYVCCNGQLFYEALLAMRLYQLDLNYKPLSSTLISSLGSDPLVLGESLWQANGVSEKARDINSSAFAFTLVSYINQRWEDIPLTSMQRNLATANTFNDWINSTITKVSPEDFCSGWQRYMVDLATSQEE